MAKTFQQIVQEEIGGLHMTVLELTAVNGQLKEENEALKKELEVLKPKDKKVEK